MFYVRWKGEAKTCGIRRPHPQESGGVMGSLAPQVLACVVVCVCVHFRKWGKGREKITDVQCCHYKNAFEWLANVRGDPPVRAPDEVQSWKEGQSLTKPQCVNNCRPTWIFTRVGGCLPEGRIRILGKPKNQKSTARLVKTSWSQGRIMGPPIYNRLLVNTS